MKRLLAVLAVLCCLTLMQPTALAEPAEESADQQTQSGEENAAAENQENQENTEAEAAEPEETAPTATTVNPFPTETAIHAWQVGVSVDEHGEASVTQRVELQIVGSLQEIRIAFPKDAKGARIEGYKTKSEKEDNLRYLVVSSDEGFTGTQTLTFSYTQSGLVSQGEGSQKLTLPVLTPQDYPAVGPVFSVTLHQSFETKPSFSSGYYNDMIEDLMTTEVDNGVVTGLLTGNLRDHESLTMTLTVPEGFFTGSFGESMFSTVLLILTVLLLVLALLYWWRTLSNSAMRVHARTLPPDGVNPGDVPYLLAGGDADFNMLVSHWATLGYLSFYINKSGHVILRRRMGMGNERRMYERKLFELLFRQDDLCDGASLHYKKVGEKAMAVIPRYWGKRLYDKRSGSPFLAKLICCLACAAATLLAMDAIAPEKFHALYLVAAPVAGFALSWLLMGSVGAYYLNDWLRLALGVGGGLLLLILGGMGGMTLLMLPAVAVSAFLGWQTNHGGRRSAYGDEVISQTLGFRRFLHNATDQHMLQMLRRDPQYFYKILPYAEAIGQGRRFVALFDDAQLETCQWYESARGTPTTALAFYDHYCETLAMLNVSIRR